MAVGVWWVDGFSTLELQNIGSAFQKKHTENTELYLVLFFLNGVSFMDGLKYNCRHLLSFLRSFFLLT